MAPRAARRTNAGLLALVLGASATGVLAYGVGVPQAARPVVLAHGALGLALLLLVPAKAAVVRAASSAGGGRTALGDALTATTALAVLTGVAHALGATGWGLGITALQVHVAAAVAGVGLLAGHVVRHGLRTARLRRTDLRRRAVLRTALTALGGAAAWAALEGVARAASLPGARRRATGSYERGSGDPAAMPVTQWLGDGVPPGAGGRDPVVRVRDRAGVRPVDLRELPATTRTAVLDCTGGWWAEQAWTGVLLADLLPGLDPDAAVDVVSRTGYRRRLPARDAGHLLLATAVAGAPLGAGHGAPVRLVAPGRRGFWWVKWVESVEVVDGPWWAQSPFPLQ